MVIPRPKAESPSSDADNAPEEVTQKALDFSWDFRAGVPHTFRPLQRMFSTEVFHDAWVLDFYRLLTVARAT